MHKTSTPPFRPTPQEMLVNQPFHLHHQLKEEPTKLRPDRSRRMY